ncbi:polypeptide N-acetylgalactosaminyltransferase 9 isoform X1 [Echeneis naucrates]|uniref:polypeptide N-acetylgalactosaminyltransferase 9 isoform X1 n=1 Tax=Echeneis naucrates TaxID=173247 RepID=UPI001113E8E5|nr:polypeptide N-acetylgalactosaminyltransferase 9 isoform X1 [Echeneis naucrates]
MAVARKIKTLLTVNILVFVGIILFSVYCRIQDRSEELIQLGRISDQRLRARNGKVSNLVDRQSILQRLERLEDVVYNQLNGLAKPMGLVEGPGGLGQGGAAATLGEDSRDAEGKYEEYGYNAQLSDRISLDRTIPDYRPKKCKQLTYPEDLPQISVVFIFVNEALSVILRSVHSVVNHTPAHLLKEIILVDDNSDSVELKFNLDQYVNNRYPGLVKIVRNSKREGLIRARIHGWNAATAPVVGFFDAHVEFNTGWAEPILTRMKEDHTRIILPAIDNIKYNTFEVQQYANAAHGYNWGLWCMYIIPPQEWLDKGDETAPIRTPAMIGCSFVVDREYFGEIGLLDPGMEVYGGENIELGMRVWQCGGSMEVLPCARVAHIERTKKPYNNDIDYYAKRNALRAAEVWMDEYKSHVYMAWNIPMNNPGVDFGDVSERLALRKRLQCQSFRWYLEHVYPEMRIYNNTITYGEVRNSKASGYCLDQGSEDDDKAILYPCHGMSSQLARYSTEGLLQLGPLGSTTFLPDTKCLVDDGRGRTPSLKKCDAVSRISQRLWDFTQNGPIISRDTGRCLEVEMSKDANFGLRLVVQRCSGQKWMIRNWIKQEQGQVVLVCGISHYTLRCTLSFPQATELRTLSVKKGKDRFMCSIELCAPFGMAHVSDIQPHVQNSVSRHLSAAPEGGSISE